jgi:hypothetical protein
MTSLSDQTVNEIARVGGMYELRDATDAIQLGGGLFTDGRSVHLAMLELRRQKPFLFRSNAEMQPTQRDAVVREAKRLAARGAPTGSVNRQSLSARDRAVASLRPPSVRGYSGSPLRGVPSKDHHERSPRHPDRG